MWKDGEHPDHLTLQKFLSGRLRDDQHQASVEGHIERCDQCARFLDQVPIDDLFLNATPVSGRGDANPNAEKQTARTRQYYSLTGNQLGKYRIMDVLGQGGMGTVYLAEDTVLKRDVAIKVLRSEIHTTNSQLMQLIEEARTAGAIAHPNVVTIYDFASDADVDFLAMEYLAGGSAADLISSSPTIDWQEGVRLMSEACQGIDAAHRRGILHRDIKPANLLLTRDQQVKVVDFGLATPAALGAIGASGMIAGTVHFMSPEQCRDEQIDQRSDIYSMGATLYMLLTGIPPFGEYNSVEQITLAHSHAPVPDLRQLNSSIPESCARIVSRAMAKNRNDRHSCCGELLDDLSSISKTSSLNLGNSHWRQITRLPTGPTVIIMPPKCLSDDPNDALLAAGIAYEINSQLSQFQNLRVVAHRTAALDKTRQLQNDELKRSLSADYVVSGTIQRMGKQLRLMATLSSTDTSTTKWSQRFDRELTEDNLFDIQDEIAESVSSQLGQPYGEVHRAERSKAEGNADLNAYRSVLRFYDYWHRESFEEYWSVRNELSKVVERIPDYAPARAALALMMVNAVRVHNLRNHEDALDAAADHARRALRLNPKSEMAHQAAVTSHFHLGHMEQFNASADRALRAYPNHCELLADIGLFLIVTGQKDRGLPLAEKAIALSPDPPNWYFSSLVCSSMLCGDFERALDFARRVGVETIWGQLQHVVSLSHLGRISEAIAYLKKAESLVPELASQIGSMLSFFHVSRELRNIFLNGLESAGLETG